MISLGQLSVESYIRLSLPRYLYFSSACQHHLWAQDRRHQEWAPLCLRDSSGKFGTSRGIAFRGMRLLSLCEATPDMLHRENEANHGDSCPLTIDEEPLTVRLGRSVHRFGVLDVMIYNGFFRRRVSST